MVSQDWCEYFGPGSSSWSSSWFPPPPPPPPPGQRAPLASSPPAGTAKSRLLLVKICRWSSWYVLLTGCLLRSSGGESSFRPSSGSYGNLGMCQLMMMIGMVRMMMLIIILTWCLPNRKPSRTLSSNQLLLKLHDSLTQPWKEVLIMVMEIIYTQSH